MGAVVLYVNYSGGLVLLGSPSPLLCALFRKLTLGMAVSVIRAVIVESALCSKRIALGYIDNASTLC